MSQPFCEQIHPQEYHAILEGGKQRINQKGFGKVMQTMNKEEQKKIVAPLSYWLGRYIPHLMFISQHHHEVKEEKTGRLVVQNSATHLTLSPSIR